MIESLLIEVDSSDYLLYKNEMATLPGQKWEGGHYYYLGAIKMA